MPTVRLHTCWIAMKVKFIRSARTWALIVFINWLIPVLQNLKRRRLITIQLSMQKMNRYPSSKKKIVVLGSGPNRIGQGIEFDYSCVHGVLAAKECGYETIMINCNPETVSTDFDIADKLYFEPVSGNIFTISSSMKNRKVLSFSLVDKRL